MAITPTHLLNAAEAEVASLKHETWKIWFGVWMLVFQRILSIGFSPFFPIFPILFPFPIDF
jgi:hypothetical protein